MHVLMFNHGVDWTAVTLQWERAQQSAYISARGI